ncbi:glycoside hydrolase [Micromonospora sp. DR5-3]|uniref:sialidase family protein n=1 Tax=unclassified Micromonospora TaxID=2617518 RepID=UPI0016521BAB|nr:MULTISPECIES: sialidase family protein [unclassified Micromonospora]MCW3818906.1 glycoside hydrolase [Micromonospora sp. DR5-3]
MKLALTVVAALVAGSALAVPANASALARVGRSEVRDFDAEALNAPPDGTTVRGSVLVAEAPFGSFHNRAVHMTDTSTTTQSRVIFPSNPAAAKHFEFDVSLHQVVQPVFIAVHGTGARTDLGAWRFMIAPVYGRTPNAQVSTYSGTSWQRLAIIPDLTQRDHVTHMRIDATPNEAVLSVGDFVFRTTVSASRASDITDIELASSGASPTGSDVFLDNLATLDIPTDDPTLTPGVTPTGVLTSITQGLGTDFQKVATFADEGASAPDFGAKVHVGDRWVNGLVQGSAGAFTVSALLTEPHIGLQPVSVTLTDRRTGVRRSTQMRTQSYSRIPTTVVAQEPASAAEPRFPDALRLADGRLLVVYHYADGHTQANGVIRAVASDDNGQTWSQPYTVVQNAYDNRDPKITQLRDGTVLLTMFRTDWSTSSAGVNLGTLVFRSTDGGRTFPDSTKIDSVQPGAWAHAPAVELPNGDVIQPLYGWGARIARSTDGGRSFQAANEVMVVADTSAFSYGEPNVTLLPTGELVMLIRTNDRAFGADVGSVITRSFDGGHTWTALEASGIPTSSHHQMITRDGSVLLTFGNPEQAGRPTYAALIKHPSGSWSHYPQVPLYNSGWDDQANPSSVELPDGSFLSFGFDVGSRTVVSWPTNPDTYRPTPAVGN